MIDNWLITVSYRNLKLPYPYVSPSRGRPQQEIDDDVADAGSQRRKHRRLYAREYRAQVILALPTLITQWIIRLR